MDNTKEKKEHTLDELQDMIFGNEQPQFEDKQLQYTIVNHRARKKLNLTMFEYCVADSIYHLSNNTEHKGWCIASKEHIADFIGLTRRHVIEILYGRHGTKKKDKLGLIEKCIVQVAEPDNKQDPRLKTTELWYDTVIMKKRCEKISQGCEKISHLNNKNSEKISHYKDERYKDNNKENVRSEIVSFFEQFKIKEKDRKMWINKYDLDHLVRQLRYTEKQSNIRDYTEYIQAALDNDYASSSAEKLDKKEREWQEKKEQENREAKKSPVINTPLINVNESQLDNPFITEEDNQDLLTEIDELADKKIRELRKILIYEKDPEIQAKVRKMIIDIESGMSVKEQEKQINEWLPVLKQTATEV